MRVQVVLILLLVQGVCFGQANNTIQIKFDQKLLSKLDSGILNGKFTKVTSVLIAYKGQIVHEKYYEGFNVNSLHDTRSATKTVTGMLVGIAIDKKMIASEKDPVVKYFTDKKPFENPDQRKDKITLEDLLTMSSLLECDDDNQFSRGNEERMYLIEDYFQFALDLPIRGFPGFATKPADSPYGRSFSYCTAGVVLLGGAVERGSKTDVDSFAKRNLFGPLGITEYQWSMTPMGMPMTGGGLKLSTRSLYKLAQLYAYGGQWNNQQLISSQWIQKSTTPKAEARENVEYGYLWWLQKFGKNEMYAAYYMAGNGGSKIAVFPALDLVVVITSNWYGTGKAHQQSEAILNEFVLPSIKQ